jgi:hypothetical protein
MLRCSRSVFRLNLASQATKSPLTPYDLENHSCFNQGPGVSHGTYLLTEARMAPETFLNISWVEVSFRVFQFGNSRTPARITPLSAESGRDSEPRNRVMEPFETPRIDREILLVFY